MSHKIFVVLAVLAVALVAGCSRQPQHHLGEWGAQLYNVDEPPVRGGYFHFSKDGKVKANWKTPAGPVAWEGEYGIDYSKDPIQLDIRWEKTPPGNIHGSIRFIGEGKNKMQYLFESASEPRPADFNYPKRFYLLKKKVLK